MIRRGLLLAGVCSLWTFGGLSAQTPSFEQLAQESLAQLEGQIELPGLRGEVEVLRDQWGVPHIYAESVDDLFFAQGFVTAQDRLWQMELWRRQHEGRYSEILGPVALEYDRLQRMLKFRGPYGDSEWKNYHPEGKRIFDAYAAGVNAFIQANRDNLPVEFKLTGIDPNLWTAEDLVGRARMHWSIRDAQRELRLAMSVAQNGLEEADRLAPTIPSDNLTIPEGLDVSIITVDVIEALETTDFDDMRPEILPEFAGLVGAMASLDMGVPETWPGSNNWAIRPELTATGSAIVMDDPHRQVSNPAHRHMVHLNAPGWNVAGGIEPGLPGVMRGHNGLVAWGRTATTTDLADVYVEQVNPDNSNEVLYNGNWEPLEVIVEEIPVKGEAPRRVELKFSRHGPIFYDDPINNRAYALRSVHREPGTAEYIGGLQLNSATSARDCLEMANNIPMPPSNLTCGSADGDIAYRVAAFAPKRDGWNGRLPVPGTGEFEWGPGRRSDLPSEYNPARGFITTANEPNVPPTWDPPYGFVSPDDSSPRYLRIDELLRDAPSFTMDDMVRILNDSYRADAAENVDFYFQHWNAADDEVERARGMIAEWDAFYERDSSAAAIYATWARNTDFATLRDADGPDQVKALITDGLRRVIDELTAAQGSDWRQWRWGRMNVSTFPHYLVSAYDLPSVERGGGSGTVRAVGGVYRLITDFSDLDNSRVIIAPGLSGQPGSPFYGNLLEMWANGEFFRLPYTREAVEASTRYRLRLIPGDN